QPGPGDRVHDGAQADANHDREGVGEAGRVGAQPCVSRPADRGTDAATTCGRSSGQSLRRISFRIGDAGAIGQTGLVRRAGPDSGITGRIGRGREMNMVETLLARPSMIALGWALLHFIWQGTLVALLLAGVLRAFRSWSTNARYGAACVAMIL